MDTLTITKGAETLDFDGGGNFFVRWDRFPISVTKRRRSLLGGSLYEDTAERWTVNISGANTAAAVNAADDLVRVIESAEDWWEGQDDDVVLVNYQPENSGLGAALKSVIIGAPAGRPVLQLPGDFDAVGLQPTIKDALLSFVRRGPWLAAGETQSDTATTSPDEMAVTFGTAAENLSPVDIELRDFVSSAASDFDIPPGALFVYQDATDFRLWDAATQIRSGFSTHVDTTAHGNQVARLTTASGEIGAAFDDTIVTGRNIALYAVVHNLDSSTSWNLTTTMANTSTATSNTRSNIISLPTGDTEKALVCLGYFTRARDASYWILAADRTAGSGTIEVNFVCAIDLDKPTTYIISNLSFAESTVAFASQSAKWVYDSGALSAPAATAYISQQTDDTPIIGLDTRGDLAIHMQGTTVRARYIAPGNGVDSGDGNSGNNWIIQDDNGDWNPVLRVTRYVAYTVPQ